MMLYFSNDVIRNIFVRFSNIVINNLVDSLYVSVINFASYKLFPFYWNLFQPISMNFEILTRPNITVVFKYKLQGLNSLGLLKHF